jgi:hypothetical protein
VEISIRFERQHVLIRRFRCLICLSEYEDDEMLSRLNMFVLVLNVDIQGHCRVSMCFMCRASTEYDDHNCTIANAIVVAESKRQLPYLQEPRLVSILNISAYRYYR